MRKLAASRVLVCCLTAVFCALPNAAQADELRRLFLLILDDPASIALNVKYARLAEDRGEYSRALLAWERVFANHPDNLEAKQNVEHLRRIVKPSKTNYMVSVTAQANSNAPLRDPSYKTYEDGSMNTLLFARDERSVGQTRLGTDVILYGNFNNRYTEGDAALFSVSSGPFINLSNEFRVRVAPEFSKVRLNRSAMYHAGALLIEAEAGEGSLPFSAAKLKVGYEDYVGSYLEYEAPFLDLNSTFAYSDVLFDPNDQFTISPTLHFQKSKAPESRYALLGTTMRYAYPLTERLVLEPELTVEAYRYAGYADTEDSPRRDQTVTPSVTTTLNDFLTDGVSLSGKYEYTRNFSNDGANAYKNHQLGMTMSWLY